MSADREADEAPKAKVGECCEAMDFVTWRGIDARAGIMVEQSMNFTTGDLTPVVVTRFRKGKKGDSRYGPGQPGANATWAFLNYCPFCGKKLRPV